MAFHITGVSMVCSTVCSGADHRKHQRSESLAFVRRIHRWPVKSSQKGLVTRKMFPFDDVIMRSSYNTDNMRTVYVLLHSVVVKCRMTFSMILSLPLGNPMFVPVFSQATLKHMDKCLAWISQDQWYNNKTMPNKNVCMIQCIYCISIRWYFHMMPHNLNPILGVATIRHQIRYMHWGHPSLLHAATSLLNWYKMTCLVNILYRVKFMSMLSIYTHQKSLATLDGEIVDPEITVKLEMRDVLKVHDALT